MTEHEHDPLRDAPLFRELQRLLFSSSGPVNWELARQVGIATAVGDQQDPEPTDEDRALLEQTVRAAELAVADHTGLEPPEEVTRVQLVRRAAWVEANARGLRSMFEPGAEKLGAAMADAQRHELDELAPGAIPGLDQVMGRVAPLLMGTQIGMVLGALGRKVLGQYELPIPRDEASGLLFVIPNIRELEVEWSLDPAELRAWVALHETTHAFELGRPWVREHFLAQVRELTESMEFDLSGLQERLAGLDLSNPEAMTEGLGPEGLLGQTMTDEQRLLMRRLQAFMAAAEGYADHVMGRVGARMLRSYAQIEEAMLRRREQRGDEDRMMEQLLGLELKREQYVLGRAFCEKVVEAADEATLARMWESADTLPSMPELEEPTLWLSRIV